MKTHFTFSLLLISIIHLNGQSIIIENIPDVPAPDFFEHQSTIDPLYMYDKEGNHRVTSYATNY